MQGFGNMTRPDDGFGNSTAFGMQGFGNMTPPEMPAGGFGNSTAPGTGPGSMQGFGNGTAPQGVPAQGPGNGNGASQSGNSNQPATNQQTKEDVIADLINRLQGLLSGKV
jgi:hypothetical protein